MDRGLVGAVNTQRSRTEDYVTREEFAIFKQKFLSARVTNVIYDENSPGFDDLGKWNSIGTIQFEIVDYQTGRGNSVGSARPYFGNIKQYPLVNEIVFLFRLPGNDLNFATDSEDYYYINPVSIWNHQHHNAMPNLVDGEDDENQQQDYQNIEGGSARRVEDGSTEINLNGQSGGKFVEKSDIHPLLPFAGDVILEGRFGNSIRLGNTSKTDSSYANIWSSTGADGDPITIIRNGQPSDSSDEGWLPITENANTDLSSLTLTSTQQLPLELSNEDYSAFDDAPETAANYSSNQAYLNSGRLVFNSKTSDVIISSAGHVAVNAIKTLGLSGDQNIVLNSSNISIGNKNADQRLVRGDDFMVQFSALVQGVKNLCDKLKTAQNWPGGSPVPNIPVATVAINTSITAQKILDNMKGDNKLLSKVAKTD